MRRSTVKNSHPKSVSALFSFPHRFEPKLCLLFIFLTRTLLLFSAVESGQHIEQEKPFSPELSYSLPPFLEEHVVYFNSFSKEDGRAEINTASAEQDQPVSITRDGFTASSLGISPQKKFLITSRHFSPHRPLTLSFWWAVEEELAKNAGGGFVAFTGAGRRYISNFCRGGPWCGLDDTAFCFQAYNFPGIQNVHSTFDRNFRQHYPVGGGIWHHTVLTFTMGSQITLYVDGSLAAQYTLKGGTFKAADKVHSIRFGGFPSRLFLDDIMVLNTALDRTAVQAYYRALCDIHYAWRR